jgi:hypothetical protein
MHHLAGCTGNECNTALADRDLRLDQLTFIASEHDATHAKGMEITNFTWQRLT